MKPFVTINPASGSVLAEYSYMAGAKVEKALAGAQTAFENWRQTDMDARLAPLARLAALLEGDATRLGHLMTQEMGKPLTQSHKEVEKCAVACRYYVEHAASILAPRPVATEARRSYVSHAPLGPVLCIMPWNFPYWQVIRFAVPALCAGNSVLLKHAENTTGVGLELERLFSAAGFPPGCFQTLVIDHDQTAQVIGDTRVQAVSLTGSDRAGRIVGALAGKHLKKSVLELGGSDPYLILKDADLEHAVDVCVNARLVNGGQSCIAAKRFIVVQELHDAFVEAFVERARNKVVGDPTDERCDVGPLAKEGIRDSLATQVERSVAAGARLVLGGQPQSGPGFYYPVTVLTGVEPGMPAFEEETFGPAAAIIRAKDEDHAISLANRSRFGLGGAIFSRDTERAERLARDHLAVGFAAVNGMVASDPRLPFGGIKESGYGRELADVGLKEFVNVKTIVVHRP